MSAVGTSFAGLGDDGAEVAEIGLFRHAGEFVRGPKIRAGGIDAFDALECVGGSGDWQRIAHGVRFIRRNGSNEERIFRS